MTLMVEIMKAVIRRFPEAQRGAIQCEQFSKDDQLADEARRLLAGQAAAPLTEKAPPSVQPIEKYRQSVGALFGCGDGISADSGEEVNPVSIFKRKDKERASLITHDAKAHSTYFEVIFRWCDPFDDETGRTVNRSQRGVNVKL
jgi:hypothetical protein